MRKFPSLKGVPFLALAAALALLAPGAPLAHAASHRANIELLSSQLQGGETLASAPVKDLSAAVRSAVAKRPADAADIVRIAIMAKKRKQQPPTCETIRSIVEAAIAGAPDHSRDISEMAQALAPDCSAEIAQAVNGGITTGATTAGAAVPGTPSGDNDFTLAGTDFGGGFGPGYPGSPTFGGSSPSGGFALPPMPSPATGSTTTVVNN